MKNCKKSGIFISLLIISVNWSCAQKKTKSENKISIDTSTQQMVMSNKIKKTEEEWKKILSKEQFLILRDKGTERPYTGTLLNNKEKGIYKCAGCGNELFTDEMKFDSHCGWPSFDKEIAGGKIIQHKDTTLGMVRTEIVCAKCDGHLGHIFDDGPTETGQRYCVNSLSLTFDKIKQSTNIETIVLGGGCFWCVEAVYEKLKGVTKVESGYAGGKNPNPTYNEICTGTTNHAEVIKITYNTDELKLEEILNVFFAVHDPTTLNRQGADVGTQYRSVIFYQNETQKIIAENKIKELELNTIFSTKIVTELSLLPIFYKAEEYHQNYYAQNSRQGYCANVITPKMEKFKKLFKDKIKE